MFTRSCSESTFFRQTDQSILLNAKERLKQLKADDSAPEDKIKILVVLLRTVATVVNKITSSPNHKVAAWLLLADLYGTLSYTLSLKSDKSQKNIENALNQAFHCVDKVKIIIKDLPAGCVLDIEFIKKCNTFDVSDVDGALQYIADELITPLIAQNDDQPLYQSLGAGL